MSQKVFEQQDEKVKVIMDKVAEKLERELTEFGFKIITHEIEGAGYFFFIQHPTGDYPHQVFAILDSQRRAYIKSKLALHFFVTQPKDEQGQPRHPYIPFIQGWMVREEDGTES